MSVLSHPPPKKEKIDLNLGGTASLTNFVAVYAFFSKITTLQHTKKTDHITPVLADLHWLPIEQRLKYKICHIVYKIVYDKAPSYLTELVQPYVPGHRGLRFSTQGLLQEEFSKHQWGQRSFQVAAPKLWNNLPGSVKLFNSLHSFKKNLKTYLYLEAFART